MPIYILGSSRYSSGLKVSSLRVLPDSDSLRKHLVEKHQKWIQHAIVDMSNPGLADSYKDSINKRIHSFEEWLLSASTYDQRIYMFDCPDGKTPGHNLNTKKLYQLLFVDKIP